MLKWPHTGPSHSWCHTTASWHAFAERVGLFCGTQQHVTRSFIGRILLLGSRRRSFGVRVRTQPSAGGENIFGACKKIKVLAWVRGLYAGSCNAVVRYPLGPQ